MGAKEKLRNTPSKNNKLGGGDNNDREVRLKELKNILEELGFSTNVFNLSYDSFTGLIFQSGSSAPTVQIMENTIGTITWSRLGAGTYQGRCIGAFPEGKTFLAPIGQNGSTLSVVLGSLPNYYIWRVDDDTIEIDVSTSAGVASDNLLGENTIEIRVYK